MPPPNKDRSTTMTRKDFELIAGVFSNRLKVAGFDKKGSAERALITNLAEQFAKELAGTNDRFDSKKFLEFCGVK
jgi:hypothetical protein